VRTYVGVEDEVDPDIPDENEQENIPIAEEVKMDVDRLEQEFNFLHGQGYF